MLLDAENLMLFEDKKYIYYYPKDTLLGHGLPRFEGAQSRLTECLNASLNIFISQPQLHDSLSVKGVL